MQEEGPIGEQIESGDMIFVAVASEAPRDVIEFAEPWSYSKRGVDEYGFLAASYEQRVAIGVAATLWSVENACNSEALLFESVGHVR